MKVKNLSKKVTYECSRCLCHKTVNRERGELPHGWYMRNGYLLCGECDF